MTGLPLSAMELFILQRMALGDTYTESGRRWGTTGRSAGFAGYRAIHKLGARNIVHAAVIALTTGLIHPEECGTVRTYYWHKAHGEKPCTACKAARGDHDRPLAYYRRKDQQS